MWDLLFWSYLALATLLLVHEIDSAFWQEWRLFRLPGGLGGFLLLHLPIVAVLLFGQAAIAQQRTLGLIVSIIAAAGGLFACAIHGYVLKRGREEFRHPVSIGVLVVLLPVSLLVMGVSLSLF
jgi:hypothetical protein